MDEFNSIGMVESGWISLQFTYLPRFEVLSDLTDDMARTNYCGTHLTYNVFRLIYCHIYSCVLPHPTVKKYNYKDYQAPTLYELK